MSKSKTSKTFAAKLAAFYLNTVDHQIRCSEKNGFSSSAKETVGVLPLLHLNITKKDFAAIMHSTHGDMHKAMKKVCKAHHLDKTLAKVNFNCDKQCDGAASILVERVIETIDTGYTSRKVGIKRTSELAAHMRWQVKHSIIPESSIAWCKGVRSASGVQPTSAHVSPMHGGDAYAPFPTEESLLYDGGAHKRRHT